MKLTNLLVPIVVLTTLNNNKSSAFKVEIENASLPHQLEIVNWDRSLSDIELVKGENLFSLTAPINIKEGGNEKIVSHSGSCDALYRSIMDTCNALDGKKKIACQAVAYSTYLGCLGAGGDNL